MNRTLHQWTAWGEEGCSSQQRPCSCEGAHHEARQCKPSLRRVAGQGTDPCLCAAATYTPSCTDHNTLPPKAHCSLQPHDARQASHGGSVRRMDHLPSSGYAAWWGMVGWTSHSSWNAAG